MSEPLLEVSSLTVQYGKRVAVDDFSIRLRPGEIVAMLGPNGAGKSTFLSAIAGSLMPTAGDICVGGVSLKTDPLKGRSRVGFADQPPSLYDFFTVEEHLAFVGEARGSSDTSGHRALLQDLGLDSIAHRLCRELSFGMRQRVGLAAALVGGVDVVLLDETLNGLDPRAAVRSRTVLRKAAGAGAAIVMSTHLLGVAERLCQRILIMDQGSLKADVRGAELEELLAQGAGAVENLYLSLVADDSEKREGASFHG